MNVTIKNIMLITFSAVGGIIADFVGGVDTILKALIIFMVVDYITGLLVALVFHKSTKTAGGGASSKEGLKGILKKVCMLLFVGLTHMLDIVMKTEYIRAMTISFFLANEGLSVIENMGLMGIKCPLFTKKALEVLRDKHESEEKK